MKATELITRLQQLVAEHGDLDVARWDIDYWTYFTFDAGDVDQQDMLENQFDRRQPTGPFIGIGQ